MTMHNKVAETKSEQKEKRREAVMLFTVDVASAGLWSANAVAA